MLKDEIGIFHACLAQAFLGCWFSSGWRSRLLDRHSRFNSVVSLWLPIATTLLIYVSWRSVRRCDINIAIFRSSIFPPPTRELFRMLAPRASPRSTSGGKLRALSDVNAFQIWLQLAHRFVALIIAAFVVTFWFLVRGRVRQSGLLRNLSNWWVFSRRLQIALGAWTVWSNKAADFATAHVAIGAVNLCYGCSSCRDLYPTSQTRLPAGPIPQIARYGRCSFLMKTPSVTTSPASTSSTEVASFPTLPN